MVHLWRPGHDKSVEVTSILWRHPALRHYFDEDANVVLFDVCIQSVCFGSTTGKKYRFRGSWNVLELVHAVSARLYPDTKHRVTEKTTEKKKRASGLQAMLMLRVYVWVGCIASSL